MKNFLKSTALTALIPAMLCAPLAQARSVDIEITNLTSSLFFTPLLVTAHRVGLDFFETGQPASMPLQAMAEGGDISGLSQLAIEAGASNAVNPAAGLLAPGQHATVSGLDIKHRGLISIVGMLLPTNDGFVGLDSWSIPKKHGRYTIYLNGYDAGTEINDEVITGGGAPGVAGIPADPGGFAGTGATGVTLNEPNGLVHVHRGNVGDLNPVGGPSDLDAAVHRWLNPVAKVVVTVR